MLDLLNHNKKILNNYIEYWDGKKINGKVITESGILAGFIWLDQVMLKDT